MKICGVLLCLLLCSLRGIAQDHSFVVKETDGDVVPFICVVCEKSNHYAISDNQGTVVLRQNDFAESDVLVFQSIFYEPLRIEAARLKTMKEVVLTPMTREINAVYVYSDNYVNDLVKRMASNFSQNTAKDYAVKITWLSSIECNGKYREFMGYYGLFVSCGFNLSPSSFNWEDKNLRYWFPLTVMKSDPLAAGSDEVLEINSVTAGSAGDISNLKIRYVNKEDDPWVGKRALEIYSPLNPKQIKNFNYRIDSSYTTNEGEVLVIHFKNKSGSFPRKTKIIGQGYIHCLLKEDRPIKVVTENIEDHYTYFPRTTTSAYPSVTQHRVEVEYGVSAGKIYTSKIVMHIDWVDPGINTGRYYSYGQQRRRNPVGNSLREYRYIAFTDPVLLDKNQTVIVRNNALAQGQYNFVLTAPFDRVHWENVVMHGIDRHKLFNDLTVSNMSLYEQAEKNALAVPEENGDPAFYGRIIERYGSVERYEEMVKKRVSQYYKISRNTIYPTLYGRYYD